MASTYDMVEQMSYLYVSVVKARDLPTMDITGALDPYVEVRLGNFKGVTKHLEKNPNPVWRQVFAFSREHLQANQLEVVVKDKDVLKDDFVGRVLFDMIDIPHRVPPDSPLAPQWYRLADRHGEKLRHGEIMLAVWIGTQADEAFPEAWHSDAHSVSLEGLTNTRSKVYYSPKLAYLKVVAISAQDLVPAEKGRPLAPTIAKIQLGAQIRRDAPGAAAGVGQPGVERGVHVRRRGAVRRAAGGDGRGARGPRAGRAAGPRDHPGGGAVRAPQRPGQVGGVQVVQPVARAVGGRGGGGRHGQEEGAQDVREQDPPAAEPGDGVPRAGRVDALQQRPAAVREEAAQGRHRGPGPGHPERARPGAHEGQAGGPDGPLLRGQVRRQVGAHAHAAQHARAAVERAVHLGRVRPLHRPHRGRLRQLPRRRRRRRRQGPEDRQGAHPPLDAGDRPRVHALLPADGAQPVGPEEDGGAPPCRPLHLHRLGQHAHHVRQAAAPQDALLQPHLRSADGLPPVPGHADGGDAAGPRGAAAAEGGGGVHAGRGLAHVQPAAEQGQLLPDHVALLGRGGGGQVVRRHLQVEEPADDDPGARAVPDPGVLPGADPAHRLPLPLHDRAVELPPAAAQAHAHGHGAVARRAGAPGRAGRGVRHVPDLQAGGGRADEVRPAAERGRAGADGGGRPGDAGGARAVAAELARPQGDGHLHHAGAHRGRGALRHAVPGGGRRGGAVPPPAPAVPEQAAVRAIQLLQAPARQVRHAAMNPYCHTAILPFHRGRLAAAAAASPVQVYNKAARSKTHGAKGRACCCCCCFCLDHPFFTTTAAQWVEAFLRFSSSVSSQEKHSAEASQH